MLTNLIVIFTSQYIYMHHIVTLYSLNLYNIICRLCLGKAGKLIHPGAFITQCRQLLPLGCVPRWRAGMAKSQSLMPKLLLPTPHTLYFTNVNQIQELANNHDYKIQKFKGEMIFPRRNNVSKPRAHHSPAARGRPLLRRELCPSR